MAPEPLKSRILLYILRRDIRLSDNPIFHYASLFSACDDAQRSTLVSHNPESFSSTKDGFPQFTHLLPIYVFPAHQVQVSGFLAKDSDVYPYADARSQVAGIWRTGPHRAKFMAEGVWELKDELEKLNCGSGLEVRVGDIGQVVQNIVDWYSDERYGGKSNHPEITSIWMTSDIGTEEKRDERNIRTIAKRNDIELKLWKDEKYYIDDDDLPFSTDSLSDLPNVYTSFRKSVEPLRSQPRKILPAPVTLPPLPPDIPPQHSPFKAPHSLDELKNALLKPIEEDPTYGLLSPPLWPEGAENAHPFTGGESAAQKRLSHLITSSAIHSYKETRNGMLGLDFSTKLGAYLAQGNLTARQIHWAMFDYEEGRGRGKTANGYGGGENEGTAAVRFELLWRDYMRLCQMKFGARMFDINGIRDLPSSNAEATGNPQTEKRWKYLDRSGAAGDNPEKTQEAFKRFCSGLTGMGLIDASNRELFLTGYTSNRARQNVASFLSSHLEIDWRIGAEWYEFLLIDYDVANNWGNWQYVAGVGNDPRQGRIFNPVKQALDYDKNGEYIKTWVPELRKIKLTNNNSGKSQSGEIDQQLLMGLYQPWRLSDWERENTGLKGYQLVENPLIRIHFSIRGRGQDSGGRSRGRGRGRGGGSWRGRGKGRDFRRMGREEKAEGNQGVDHSGVQSQITAI